MTVTAVGFSGPTFIQTPGNGAATVYTFPFLVSAAGDVIVGFIVGGAYTQQVPSTFAVAGIGNSGGGTVTFSIAPPFGTIVDIRSQIPETQPTNFANLGGYYPENTTNAVDRITRLVTDMYRFAYLFSIHGPDTENTPWTQLPAPSGRAGGSLIFDSNGLPTIGFLTAVNLTQTIFNSFLLTSPIGGTQTAAESAAGVTPVKLQYVILNPYRYGADGLGGANDTSAYSQIRAVEAQLLGTPDWLNGISVPGYPQTLQESFSTTAIPNYLAPPDAGYQLNVFRFMTPAQQIAVLGGTNTVDVSASIQAANDFLEGRSAGAILTLAVSGAMSGYINGFYPFVSMTGGSGGAGTPAKCAITVAGGVITSVVPSGPYTMTATGVPNGIAPTHTTNAAGYAAGGAYHVADTLVPVTDNTATDPGYFPSGGTGAVITVSTISTASGKTAGGGQQGGQLYFPGGYYYYASTPLRVGSGVKWVGNSRNSVQFAWATSYTGVNIYLGPDESGFFGYTGYYAVNCSLEEATLNVLVNSNPLWNVFADGIQQGSYLRAVNTQNTTNGGFFIKDNKGGSYFKISDSYIQGASIMPVNAGQPTGVAISLNYGGTVEINQVSLNGGGSAAAANGIFLDGVQINQGGALIYNFQAEEVLNAIDSLATVSAGYPLILDKSLITNTSFGTPKGLWLRSGSGQIVNTRALTAGTGIIAIQNDNTGYVAPSGSTQVVPNYIANSAVNTDISILEGVIVSGVKNNPSNVANAFTPDVALGDWQLINLTANSAYTINAPTYSGNAMPASVVGREITITLFANGATPASVTFNGVFSTNAPGTLPTNGNNTSTKFRWTGTKWYQVAPWITAVPN